MVQSYNYNQVKLENIATESNSNCNKKPEILLKTVKNRQ